MKSRIDVLNEIFAEGVNFNKRKPKPLQKKRALEFMQRHEDKNSDANQMHENLNRTQPDGTIIDGSTAEFISAAINRWRMT